MADVTALQSGWWILAEWEASPDGRNADHGATGAWIRQLRARDAAGPLLVMRWLSRDPFRYFRSIALAHCSDSPWVGACNPRGDPYCKGRPIEASPVHLTPRLLTEHCRPELTAHFGALSAHDLYLRFGAHQSPESVERYVAGIEFAASTLLGVYDDKFRLLGVMHLCPDGDTAELGLSVLAEARRHGVGTILLRRSLSFARRTGVTKLFMHCLSENEELIRLVRGAGGRIAHSNGEADAFIKLPAGTAFSTAVDLAEEHVALVQYSLLAQRAAWRMAFHYGR
ncbi:MAG TPA: GNAT family N-acetyltransferase [Steroidobacteraceae bacterium]|nr:GNAT family N-acetyltransferase [Steroidobacteraceae bacterium]